MPESTSFPVKEQDQSGTARCRLWAQERVCSATGDGLDYNWSIQQRWFPQFVPIADFVHAVEHVYTAAKAVYGDAAQRLCNAPLPKTVRCLIQLPP